MRLHSSLIAWISAALWMAGIAGGSLLPGPPLTSGTDLWLHALAYSILTVLLRFATASRGTVHSMLLAAGAAMAYGMLLEGAQAALPYRTAEARDLLANAIGVAAAILIPIRHRGAP